MLNSIKTLFSRIAQSVSPTPKKPVIRKIESVAFRASSRSQWQRTGVTSIHPDNEYLDYYTSLHLDRMYRAVSRHISYEDSQKLVLVENKGDGVFRHKTVMAGFMGTQMGASLKVVDTMTGARHQFAWVLPRPAAKKKVRFAL